MKSQLFLFIFLFLFSSNSFAVPTYPTIADALAACEATNALYGQSAYSCYAAPYANECYNSFRAYERCVEGLGYCSHRYNANCVICPDGSLAPNNDLTQCPLCPDNTTPIPSEGISGCPLCPDGITPIPSGGVTLCPCTAVPYTDKDAIGQCYKDCTESSPGPDTVTGKGCLEPKNQKESEKQCAGNPIDIASGEKIQYESPDYQSQGPLALIFSRNYQSNRAPESQFWLENNQVNPLPIPVSNEPLIRYYQPADYQGAPYAAGVSPWGKNPTDGTVKPPLAGQKQWMHNYQISLLNTGNQLIRTSPDGKAYFSNVGGGEYTSLHVTPLKIITTTLSDGSSGFVYQRTPRFAEYFNSEGQLVRIEQAPQIYQDLTYNSEGQLVQIAHSLGASLTLAYNAQGQLSQLVTPDNTSVSYSYDTVGNLSQVSKTFSNSSLTTRNQRGQNQRGQSN